MQQTGSPENHGQREPNTDGKQPAALQWFKRRRLSTVLFILLCLAVGRISLFVGSDLRGVVEGVKQIQADSLAWAGLFGRLEAQTHEAHYSIENAVTAVDPGHRVRFVEQARRSAQLATLMLHEHLKENLPPSELQAAERFMRAFRGYVSTASGALAGAAASGDKAAAEKIAKGDDAAFQQVLDATEAFRTAYAVRTRQRTGDIEKVLRHSLLQLGGLLVVVLILSAFAVRLVEKGRMLGAVEKSEKRLRDVIESISEGTFVIDRQWILRVWNAAAELNFSRKREDVVGRHLLVALPEIAATPLASEIGTALYSGSPRVLPDIQMPTGEFFEVRLFPFEKGVTVFVNDITERKRAMDAARESEERFRVMADTAPVLVWVSGEDGHMTFFNKPWLEFTGRSLDEEKGDGWLERLHPEDVFRCQETYEAAFTRREIFRVECRLQRADGEYRWLLNTGVPRCTADGTFAGYVGSAVDITSHKQAEKELVRAKEAAEQANQTKSTFLAIISHELKTPLTAIIGYSELIQEDVQARGWSELLPDLKKIHAGGRHLLTIINDILDFSKIEAGKMDLHLEKFAVTQLIEDVVNTTQPLARTNGNRLELKYLDQPGSMRADLTKVRQVLLNLLSNACKFTQNGSIILIVGRRSNSDGVDQIAFQVKDTGIGMKPNEIEKLFTPFTQADASTTRRYGGTGLGLAISRRFCQMMGGEIEVESVPGQGTCFTARIPVEVVSDTVVTK